MDIKRVYLPVAADIFTHDGIERADRLVALTHLAKANHDFTNKTRILGLDPDGIESRECVKIITKDFQEIILPSTALVQLHHGKKITAEALQEGDEISVFLADSDASTTEMDDWERFNQMRFSLAGLLVGDGTLRKCMRTSKKTGVRSIASLQYVLYFCQKNNDLEACLSQKLINQPQFHDPQAVTIARDFLGGARVRTYQQNPRKNPDGTVNHWKSRVTTTFIPNNWFEKKFLEKSEIVEYVKYHQSLAALAGFCSGLFGADSNIPAEKSQAKHIRLSQSNIVSLQAVKLMLARLGIFCTIRLNGRGQGDTYQWTEVGLDGQKVVVREGKRKTSYILQICGADLKDFVAKVGIYQTEKQEQLDDLIDRRKRFSQLPPVATIVSVEKLESQCIPVTLAKGETELTQLGLDGMKVFM